MFVLLKDTDKELDKGFYLYTPCYDRDIERALIELYYRGVAEGLVEYSVANVEDKSIKVVELKSWIEEKQKQVRTEKVQNILEELKDKVFISY